MNGEAMEMIVKSGLEIDTFQSAGFFDRPVLNASLVTRIHKAQRLAIEYYKLSSSGISCLLASCRPDAVILRIAKGIVRTLDLVLLGWARSHIRHEVPEVSPGWINGNPATAIVPERTASRIRCSTDHALPAKILWASPGSSSVTMFLCLAFQTATGFSSSRRQLARDYECMIPAFAMAQPHYLIAVILGTRKNCQEPEYFPSQVDYSISSSRIADASARFRMAASKVSGLRDRRSSTLAQTLPSHSSGRGILGPAHYCKFSKFLPSEINVLAFHWLNIPRMAKGVQQWQLSAQP